jgi:hypothetical protein
MPEVAVDEDCNAGRYKQDVWSAALFELAMQAITQSEGMQFTAQLELGSCVLLLTASKMCASFSTNPDLRHISVSAVPRYRTHQYQAGTTIGSVRSMT